jgi:hypothetical protein
VYRKSSYCSASACVEADAHWTKAAATNEAACVEAAWAKSAASQNNGGCVEAAWTKSDASNPSGNCVEAAWEKGSASLANGDCVEAAWEKSSYTQPNACVEAQWEKASESQANGGCAEVQQEPACPYVHLRDTKDRNGTVRPNPDGTPKPVVLDYPREMWHGGQAVMFQKTARRYVPAGLIAVRNSRISPLTRLRRRAWYEVTRGGQVLYFDSAERAAWLKGVTNGEFALEEETSAAA